jgi:2,3-bisphosphoglycerate-independent phosphoglycerate mutase
VKGADGTAKTNLKGKILAAKKAIKDYDFIFLHIKATDNLAEDGKFLEKKEFIEKIDQNLKPILNLKDVLIVVSGDHSTSSLKKSHCNLPNPVLIYGAEKEGCKKFSERECKKGKLGVFKQIDLMKKISTLTRVFQKNKIE